MEKNTDKKPASTNASEVKKEQASSSHTTSTATAGSTGKSGKSKKKIFGVTGIALVVVIALAVGAFAFYSQQNRVLADALAKTLAADNATTQTEVNFEMYENDVKALVNIDTAVSDGNTQANADAQISVGAASLNVQADFIGSNDNQMYVRLNNASELVSTAKTFVDEENRGAIEFFEPAIDEINGQWINLNDEGMPTEQSECAVAVTEMSRSIEQSTIRELFNDHRFITAEKADTPEGRSSFSEHHYKLGFDAEQAREFARSALDRQEFERIKNTCDITNEDIDSMFDNASSENTPEITAIVSINKLSHNPTFFSLTIADEEARLEVKSDIKLGEHKTIEVPTDAMTITEVMNNLTTRLQQQMQEQFESQFNTEGLEGMDLEGLEGQDFEFDPSMLQQQML